MSKIIATELGLFGPFDLIEELDDRLRVDGAELPFAVIGVWHVVEMDLPLGFLAANYSLENGQLQLKASAR